MSGLRCVPSEIDQRYEFHWLEFNGTEKDIWRWHNGAWRSVYNGASFTPEQLYDQRWRYVQACPPPLRHAHARQLAAA